MFMQFLVFLSLFVLQTGRRHSAIVLAKYSKTKLYDDGNFPGMYSVVLGRNQGRVALRGDGHNGVAEPWEILTMEISPHRHLVSRGWPNVRRSRRKRPIIWPKTFAPEKFDQVQLTSGG